MRIFLNSVDIIYCFLIVFNFNFKFFLKFKNLNELEILLNSYFIEVLVEFIVELNVFILVVNIGIFFIW